jgi:phosphopantetheine--protein transferase-like protein
MAGRRCARQALEQLGVAAGSLGKLPDGSIAWPEGIVGALSHSEIWCGAAVARRSDAAGIGLDIETIARIGEKLWRRILTPEERSWIAGQPAVEMQQWAALMFSAKEALYKCMAARVHRQTGFMDAVIIPCPLSQSFTVCLNEPIAAQLPGRLSLRGRFFFYAGSVFAGLVLAGC